MGANDSFCRIPITLIKKYGEEIPFDVYLRISESKIVKISQKDENILDVYEKYQAKGVKDIFARKEDYLGFVRQLKEGLNQKLFDPASLPTVEDQIETLNDSLEVVKEAFKRLGFNQESFAVAQEVSKASLQVIKNQPNIFDFFKQFKDRCSKEYMRAVLIGYISTCILDFFDWHSTAIKEKANLAAMLRDILLSGSDFNEIENAEKKGNVSDLSKMAHDHPLTTVGILEESKGQNTVAKEVLTIIEQHHELPRGDGFPRGINHQRINQLSAIHIVADHFVGLMIKEKFDFNSRDKILYLLTEKLGHGSFRKAIEGLHDALEIPY